MCQELSSSLHRGRLAFLVTCRSEGSHMWPTPQHQLCGTRLRLEGPAHVTSVHAAHGFQPWYFADNMQQALHESPGLPLRWIQQDPELLQRGPPCALPEPQSPSKTCTCMTKPSLRHLLARLVQCNPMAAPTCNPDVGTPLSRQQQLPSASADTSPRCTKILQWSAQISSSEGHSPSLSQRPMHQLNQHAALHIHDPIGSSLIPYSLCALISFLLSISHLLSLQSYMAALAPHIESDTARRDGMSHLHQTQGKHLVWSPAALFCNIQIVATGPSTGPDAQLTASFQPKVEQRLPLILCCLQAASNCTETHLLCVNNRCPAMRKPLPRQLLHSKSAGRMSD